MKQLLLVAISSYLLVLVLMVVFQRKLLYLPRPLSGATPAIFGLEFSEVKISSSDGVTVHGWWVPKSGANVTVLYCHGNAANISDLPHVAKIFNAFGWNVLFFDYRKYGNSTSSVGLSQRGLIDDAQAALNWIRTNHPDQKVMLWGHSLGAGVASHLAVIEPVDALILEGAFSSIIDAARYHYPWALLHSSMIFDKFETLSAAKQYKGPLLMIHAELDEIVPIELGRKVFAAANEPKQWIAVPNIGHVGLPDVIDKYREELMGFVEGFVRSGEELRR